MPDGPKRQYLFVACERATCWVYQERLPDKSAHQAKGFLQRLIDRASFKIKKVLTENEPKASFSGAKTSRRRVSAKRQRQGVYRPLRRQRRAYPNRQTPLRSGLPGPWYRTPSDPSQTPAVPAAWSSASTGVSARCWRTPGFNPVNIWSRPYSATLPFTTSPYRRRHSAISHLKRPSKTGTLNVPNCSKDLFTIRRDLTAIQRRFAHGARPYSRPRRPALRLQKEKGRSGLTARAPAWVSSNPRRCRGSRFRWSAFRFAVASGSPRPPGARTVRPGASALPMLGSILALRARPPPGRPWSPP